MIIIRVQVNSRFVDKITSEGFFCGNNPKPRNFDVSITVLL